MKPTLEFRALTLRIHDLDRSVDFYHRQMGFHLAERAGSVARLSVHPDAPGSLILQEDKQAPAPDENAAGLFHAALVLPNRATLSAWMRHAVDAGVRFDGFSDHGVSEAIYLSDPDGNGLEFYCDRPRASWPFRDGALAMTTLPINVNQLLAASAGVPATPSLLAGAHWGHLHLRVTDLERSSAFYLSTLGMEVMQGSIPGARFLAADGYHHHVGLNTWGHPRQPQATRALGLIEAVFACRGLTTEQATVDPNGIALRLVPTG